MRTSQAFLVSETKGTWHTAIEVPGTFGPNRFRAQLDAVSCGSAGSCSALGSYTDSSKNHQVFVVSKVPAAARG